MTIAALKSGRYRLTDELRQEMVEQATRDMRNGPTVRDRMLAVRMLAVLDAVDVQRERTDVQERQGDTQARLAAMHAAAASNPRVRDMLCELTEAMIPQGAVGPPEDAPAAALPLPPAADGDAPG